MNVWYFGTDPALKELPLTPLALENLTGGEQVEETNRGRYLAVSTTWLYGYHYNTPAARYLRTLRPVDRTTTFLIYDFTQDLAER